VKAPAGARTMDLSGSTVIPACRDARSPVLHRRRRPRGTDVVHRTTPLPRQRRHDDPNDRRSSAGSGDQHQGGDRFRSHRPAPRAPTAPHHRWVRWVCRKHGRDHDAGRGPPVRRVLVAGRRGVDQGLHRHPSRGAQAQSRKRTSAA
jgi:hypothetical protein